MQASRAEHAKHAATTLGYQRKLVHVLGWPVLPRLVASICRGVPLSAAAVLGAVGTVEQRVQLNRGVGQPAAGGNAAVGNGRGGKGGEWEELRYVLSEAVGTGKGQDIHTCVSDR